MYGIRHGTGAEPPLPHRPELPAAALTGAPSGSCRRLWGGTGCGRRQGSLSASAAVVWASMWWLASLLCLSPLLGKLWERGGDPSRLLRFSSSLTPSLPPAQDSGSGARPAVRTGLLRGRGSGGPGGAEVPGSCRSRRQPLRSPATVAPWRDGRPRLPARCPARGRRAQPSRCFRPPPETRTVCQPVHRPSAPSGAPLPSGGRLLRPVSFKLVLTGSLGCVRFLGYK